jgi:hypothetical protein
VIEKPPYCDFSSLKSRTVQILCTSNALCSFGAYSPLFHLVSSIMARNLFPKCKSSYLFQAKNGLDEGLPRNSIVLLYTFCGLAYVVGCIGTGMMTVRRSQNCMISRQYLHQAMVFCLGTVYTVQYII